MELVLTACYVQPFIFWAQGEDIPFRDVRKLRRVYAELDKRPLRVSRSHCSQNQATGGFRPGAGVGTTKKAPPERGPSTVGSAIFGRCCHHSRDYGTTMVPLIVPSKAFICTPAENPLPTLTHVPDAPAKRPVPPEIIPLMSLLIMKVERSRQRNPSVA